VLAIILGALYLLLLNACASIVLLICKVGLVMSSFWSSAYFFNAAYPKGIMAAWLSVEKGAFRGQGEVELYLGLSVACAAMCVVFVIWFVCIHRDPKAAIGCMQAASECMVSEKTLFIEPFLACIVKIIVLVGNIVGLFQILSIGKVIPHGPLGITKRMEWNDWELAAIGFNIFMFFWTQEMVDNMSQYVIAWTTQMWYFTPSVNGQKSDAKKSCLIFKGYGNVVRYHLGTIAIGSFLLAVLRPIRIVTHLVARLAEKQGGTVQEICSCCIVCFHKYLIYINRSAYMDVAVSSSDFFVASQRSVDILTKEVPEIKQLNGAQLIFQISGTWMITYVCGWLTLLSTNSMTKFTHQDSPQYIDNTNLVAVLAGGLAFFISTCFMNVFDTVGETILYCFASEQRRRKNLDKHRVAYATGGNNYVAVSTMTNVWNFFFGSDSEDEDGHVEYAPRMLQQVIKETRDEQGR